MREILIVEDNSDTLNELRNLLLSFDQNCNIQHLTRLEEFTLCYLGVSLEEDDEKRKANEKAIPVMEDKLSNIDYLFINLETYQRNHKEVFDIIFEKIKERKLHPAGSFTKLILVTKDFPKLSLRKFEHPIVFDVLVTPLDKNIFLQKMEIIDEFPKFIQPTILEPFTITEDISMGKNIDIEELSEFGLSIRNPKELQVGKFARFYSHLFYDETSPSLLARCYNSVPHPEEPKEQLCYFSFFGVRTDQLISVRNTVLEDKEFLFGDWYTRVHPDEKTDRSNDLKEFVVIDKNPITVNYLRDTFERTFKHVKYYHYPSLQTFLSTLPSPEDDKQEAENTNKFIHRPNFLTKYDQKHELGDFNKSGKLSEEKKEIQRIQAVPIDDVLIVGMHKDSNTKLYHKFKSGNHYTPFGYSDKDFNKNKDILEELIHKSSKQHFKNFIKYVYAGQDATEEFWAINKNGSPCRIEIKADYTNAKIEFFIKDVSHLYEEKYIQKPNYSNINAIYIDGTFLPDEVNSWARKLKRYLKKLGVSPSKGNTHINVMGLEDGQIRARDFEVEHIDDFFYRPLDKNLILQKMQIHILPNDAEICKESKVQYYSSKADGVLSTEVEMVEVSEHGIAIRYKIPFKHGTFMRFVNQNFHYHQGKPMGGRCYFYKPDPKNKGYYISYFEFIGLTKDSIQRIRIWIQKKRQELEELMDMKTSDLEKKLAQEKFEKAQRELKDKIKKAD